MSKQQKLVLIDGNAVFHRAYHALPPLTSPKGDPVQAVYGFTMILLKVISELKPSHILVAFDMKGPTIRHKKFKAYKAHRPPPPADLYVQLPGVKKVLNAFNIAYLEMTGHEADDIIGSAVYRYPELKKVIVTGDLDELQLVGGSTSVYTMKRGFTDTVIYDEAAVVERYGLGPEKLIDYKALRGDPSDNIPGVPGIGEKTATELVQNYGSVEDIYQNLGELPEKISAKLKEFKEEALLSKELVTIKTDLKLKGDLAEYGFGNFDRAELANLFSSLGFKSLIGKIPKSETLKNMIKRPHIAASHYHVISKPDELTAVLLKLAKKSEIVVDTETDVLDAVHPTLVGVALSAELGEAYYIDLTDKKKRPNHLEQLKALLSTGPNKISHHIKYDYMVLANYGIELGPFGFDTLLGAYLINPSRRLLSLTDLAFAELGIEMIPIEDLIGKGREQKKVSEVEIERVAEYAAEDADVTFRLYQKLSTELKKMGLDKLLHELELPLARVLGKMERRGVLIDSKKLGVLSKTLKRSIGKLETEIYADIGYEFNIASPAQLKEALFEKLQLKPELGQIKKTKTGLSTAASELDKLRGLHPVIDKLFNFREMQKMKTTYVDALPKLVHEESGRLHTSFNQAIAATGRLSSSDPNLQNIPIRSQLGEEIRSAFIASPGSLFISADYSQIELRLAAHFSNDPNMMQVFNEGEDFHAATASKLFKVPLSAVTKEMRRDAKTVNFGVLYGMGAYGLAASTGMNRKEAATFIENYYSLFSRLRDYLDEIKEKARTDKYVETMFGRRRPLPEISSPNPAIRAGAERAAINMPLQGSSADIIKKAMLEIDGRWPDLAMLLQVHDELLFEVPSVSATKTAGEIKELMENSVVLSIPLVVDVRVGPNWRDLK